MRTCRSAWAIAGVLVPAVAAAGPAPTDTAVDVASYPAAIGPSRWLGLDGVDPLPPGEASADALASYAARPVVVHPQGAEGALPAVDVVRHAATLQLAGAYGVTGWLQVGAGLPVTTYLRGDGLGADGRPAPGGLTVRGLGDLRLEAKARLLRRRGVAVAAVLGATLPTSTGSAGGAFLGDDLPAALGRVVAEVAVGPLAVGASGGVLARQARQIFEARVGSELTWAAGAALAVRPRLALVAEASGRVELTGACQGRGAPCAVLAQAPLELDAGLRWRARPTVVVSVGGGAAPLDALGAARARAFVALGFSPDASDGDADGVPGQADRCPRAAEDRDGVQDGDGCPEDDADGDRRPDAVDRCPLAAEDLDGVQDDDGCPELDNDHDGLPDLQDKCPDDAEDGAPPAPRDGCPARLRDSDGDGLRDDVDRCPLQEEDADEFEDGDGCPDPDDDHDGVPDAADQCPRCPEDRDGFEDDDGCPDPDDDRDGIPDATDRCPRQAETIDGVDDGDGCPDAGPVTVRLDGDRLIVDAVPALGRGDALSPAGASLAAQVAAVMRTRPDATRWLIAVSHPSAAARLAAAFRAALVAAGVPDASLEVAGTTGPARVAGVIKETAEAPRCPAAP